MKYNGKQYQVNPYLWIDRNFTNSLFNVLIYNIIYGRFVALNKEDYTLFLEIKDDNSKIKLFDDPTFAKFIKLKLLVTKEDLYPIKNNTSAINLYFGVTEGCNFSCPGCSVGIDTMKKRKRTPKTLTLQQIKEIILIAVKTSKKRDINALVIRWAGGEPLLPNSLKLIKAIQQTIEKLSQNYDIDIKQIILTNGSLLNKDVAEFASEYSIFLGVSLWGIGKKNSLYRTGMSNSDFEQIIKGLSELKKNNVKFHIIHVITPTNAKKFPKFISALWDYPSDDWLLSEYFPVKKSRFPIPLSVQFFRPQNKLMSKSLIKSGYKIMVSGVLSGLAKVNKLINKGLTIPAIGHLDYLEMYKIKTTTCGVGSNNLAIGPQGVSGCHEDIFLNQGSVNDMIRKYQDSKLDILEDTNKANNFYSFSNQVKENQKITSKITLDPMVEAFINYHGGMGCPKSKVNSNIKSDLSDPIITNLYSKIIGFWIQLEINRLKHELKS